MLQIFDEEKQIEILEMDINELSLTNLFIYFAVTILKVQLRRY